MKRGQVILVVALIGFLLLPTISAGFFDFITDLFTNEENEGDAQLATLYGRSSVVTELKYDFNGDTKDKSENGRDGQLQNGATIQENSLTLDGINDYLETPYAPTFTETDDFSITGWFKTDTSNGLRHIFAGYGGPDETTGKVEEIILLRFAESCSTGQLYLMIRDESTHTNNDGFIGECTQKRYDDNVWHQFAMLYDSDGKVSLYIDGGQEIEKEISPSFGRKDLQNPHMPFHIGAMNGEHTFKGQIDDITFYRSLQDLSIIKREYATGRSEEGCSPNTCENLGKECGTHDNGCGGTLNCGECKENENCNQNGQCELSCTPKTCTELGKQCGTHDNGCGQTIQCGDCAGGECDSNGMCEITCTPQTCAEIGKNCGVWTENNCNKELNCHLQIGCGIAEICTTEGQCQAQQINCVNGQKIGDVNGDGQIDEHDKNILTAIVENAIPMPNEISCADISEDGILNEEDPQFIQNIIEGKSNSPGAYPNRIAQLLLAQWNFTGNYLDSISNHITKPVGEATIYTQDEDRSSVLKLENGGYLNITPSASLNMYETSYTYMMWIKPDTLTSRMTLLTLGHHNNEGGNGVFYETWNGNYLIKFQHIQNVFYGKTKTENTLPNGEWHHIAVIYNNPLRASQICIDGNCGPLSTTEFQSLTTNIGNTFIVGRRDRFSPFEYSGLIDDIRIYNYALSESAIQTLYQQTLEENNPGSGGTDGGGTGETITCTDGDSDSYSIEGGGCGPIDCHDANVNIHPGATELCDLIDNNCNGDIDENVVRQCGSSEIGSCQLGIEICEDGVYIGCSSIEPISEICSDGKDNDCDGTTDETLCDAGCDGCLFQNRCIDIGIRVSNQNNHQYCDINRNLITQKIDGSNCANNYECSSNECSNNKCVSLLDEITEQAGLLEQIWCYLTNLFDETGYVSCIGA